MLIFFGHLLWIPDQQYQTDLQQMIYPSGLHQIIKIALWRDIEQTSEVLVYIGAEEYIEEPTMFCITR